MVLSAAAASDLPPQAQLHASRLNSLRQRGGLRIPNFDTQDGPSLNDVASEGMPSQRETWQRTLGAQRILQAQQAGINLRQSPPIAAEHIEDETDQEDSVAQQAEFLQQEEEEIDQLREAQINLKQAQQAQRQAAAAGEAAKEAKQEQASFLVNLGSMFLNTIFAIPADGGLSWAITIAQRSVQVWRTVTPQTAGNSGLEAVLNVVTPRPKLSSLIGLSHLAGILYTSWSFIAAILAVLVIMLLVLGLANMLASPLSSTLEAVSPTAADVAGTVTNRR